MLKRFLHRAQVAPASSDRLEVQALIRAVERINRVELPEWEARAALYDAIRSGDVIGLYTPVGYVTHTVELGHMARDLDPRISLEQWVEWWRAGVDPVTASSAEQRALQAAARQALDTQGGQH